MSHLKMYIAVLDTVPAHMVPILVAHSVLGAHLDFCWAPSRSSKQKYDEWLENSFRKVVLKVNQKEFDRISSVDDVYLGHENTTLGGIKSCAVVCPRYEYPNVLKYAKMWNP